MRRAFLFLLALGASCQASTLPLPPSYAKRPEFSTPVVPVSQLRGGNNNKKSLVGSLVYNFWRGVTLPFPALRSLLSKLDDDNSVALQASIAAVLGYLGLGAVVSYTLEPSWTVVDSLYATVTTFTTVGYGDLCPTSAASRLFTSAFGLVGIAFLTVAIGTLSNRVLESQAQALQVAKKASRKAFLSVFDRSGQAVEAAPAVEPKTKQSLLPTALVSSLPSLLLIFGGGILLHRLNGSKSIGDALYYSVITASTIGLGDLSPQTQAARLAAVMYIPMAVAAAGELVSTAATAIMNDDRVLEKEMAKMLTVSKLYSMDVDRNGRISQAEFFKFMVLELGLMQDDEWQTIADQFHRLDMSKTGSINHKDLEMLVKQGGLPIKN